MNVMDCPHPASKLTQGDWKMASYKVLIKGLNTQANEKPHLFIFNLFIEISRNMLQYDFMGY